MAATDRALRATALFALGIICAIVLPVVPFAASLAVVSMIALVVMPKGRKRLKVIAWMTVPLALGFWLIHGGVFSSWISGASGQKQTNYNAFDLLIRIFAIVSMGQLWNEVIPTQTFIRAIFASRIPVSAAFLTASPMLIVEQIKTRLEQIREAQLARGIQTEGSITERFSAVTAMIFPLILGLLGDLPSRSTALDMKAFRLHKKRSSMSEKKTAEICVNYDLQLISKVIVKLQGIEIKAANSDDVLLSVPNFNIAEGEICLIQGGNGSGKTTLAMLLSGGIPEHMNAKLKGSAFMLGRPLTSMDTVSWAPYVQFVQQNPLLAFSGCTFTVLEETAFGPENLCLSTAEIQNRVEKALDLPGIRNLSAHQPLHLSGGEAQKATIAAAIAMAPKILILDEAFSRIHVGDTVEILSKLKTMAKNSGTAVIILEQNTSPASDFCDHIMHIEGRTVLDGPSANIKRTYPAYNSKCGDTPLLEIKNLSFKWKDTDSDLLRSLNTGILPGERTVLVGANGAGKSTLVRLCAGLLRPTNGTVLLNGKSVHQMTPKERAAKIGFLFQDAERQIFHSTVADEVMFSLKYLPISLEEKMEKVTHALDEMGLRGLENKHPFDLNSAQRRMTAVASIAVRDSELLFLDEPTRDLDAKNQDVFENWLSGQKSAILAISHDPDFVKRAFGKVWHLKDGEIS